MRRSLRAPSPEIQGIQVGWSRCRRGTRWRSVLLQEQLEGVEWVVDTVSRAGEHKVVALYRYDKGAANGAPFVYFGMEPMPAAGAAADSICDYATAVLDVLRWVGRARTQTPTPTAQPHKDAHVSHAASCASWTRRAPRVQHAQ